MLAITILLSIIYGSEVMAAQAIEVHLSYIGSTTNTAFLGVSQGLREANLMGKFLGQSYILHEYPATAAAQAGASNPSAILAAVDVETLKQLSTLYPKIPIFNLTLEDEALRARCLPNVLHVIPSRRMRQEAWHNGASSTLRPILRPRPGILSLKSTRPNSLTGAIAKLRVGRWMIGLGLAGRSQDVR
jgi:hypothetical protein